MTATPPPAGERLVGRVAVIVGGGTTGDYPGTGSATAQLLAAQGAKLVVMGRTPEHTQRTVADIEAFGGEAVAVLGDVGRGDDCSAAVETALGQFGGIDILVNNVAVHKHVSLEQFDEETWHEIIDGNVTAIARMTSAALPALRRSGRGSIVNIGSVAGVQATGVVGYGTAKAAVEPLTRDLAVALGKDAIRVNCVIPGHLHTPHVERVGAGGDVMRDLRNRLNVLGIEGDGWDVAWATLFFAGDESRFITGQSLVVDGGVTSVLAVTQVMRTATAPGSP